jgi:3-keto-5-aminohexanoate cleavage enzyme
VTRGGRGSRVPVRSLVPESRRFDDPLVITATPNISWLHPEIDYPREVESLIAEAALCEREGARILHMHAEQDWTAAIATARAETDMLVQCGMSSLSIEQRMDVFTAGADMISVILSHHDEAFAEHDVHELHPREELAHYARLSAAHGVKLELEVWHTGSIWNLSYLIEGGLLDAPYITTLFFGWPGGSWSPPTVEEYLYRRSYMPDGCVVTVSAMGEAQIDLLTAAILHGDHVRVGTEDYPFDAGRAPATTHELVAEAVDLATRLGRPIASAEAARDLVGLRAKTVEGR